MAAVPPRSRGRRRARPSFVDESLFGSPAAARPPPPPFAPPWPVEAGPDGTPVRGPRARSSCRLKSRAPSYCDESLFGTKREDPAWMKREDVARLRALLWSPSSAPRHQPGLCSRSKETPLRAVHPRAPASPALENLSTERRGNSYIWRRPESDSGSEGRGAPGRGRSRSLSRLNTPESLPLASGYAKTENCKNQCPATAPATPRVPLMRVRSSSAAAPSFARSSKAASVCKPRPPWK
ncbi:RBPJ-interacting and tubulin-associated protein 1 [Eudromia elegans]